MSYVYGEKAFVNSWLLRVFLKEDGVSASCECESQQSSRHSGLKARCPSVRCGDRQQSVVTGSVGAGGGGGGEGVCVGGGGRKKRKQQRRRSC